MIATQALTYEELSARYRIARDSGDRASARKWERLMLAEARRLTS